RDGWPKNEKIFDGAKSVVFYMDGGSGHPLIQQGRLNKFQKYIDQKVGFVNLHYAVEYPKAPDIGGRLLTWLGGYSATGYSINPHWPADLKDLPDHPITRGVKPFKSLDEWYYNMRFPSSMRGITPILKGYPPDKTRTTPDTKAHPGREEIMAWAF